jgi:hypothetical protein
MSKYTLECISNNIKTNLFVTQDKLENDLNLLKFCFTSRSFYGGEIIIEE